MTAPFLRKGGVPSPSRRWIAGGTTLFDLMKLRISARSELVDPGPRRAMPIMAEAELHPLLQRYRAVHLALALTGSPQIREMATLGGNLLQRTRCTFFRDERSPCNKRNPGSGCGGVGSDKALAILGTSSHCVAPGTGDLTVVLAMLDAQVTVNDADGTRRTMAVTDLHRQPGDTPEIESSLLPDDLITHVVLPRHASSGQTYVKLRDHASHAFASASAAVALRLHGGVVAEARIALGGHATVPWRGRAAETSLVGRAVDLWAAMDIGRMCLSDAHGSSQNERRIELGVRAVAKALMEAGRSPLHIKGDP